LKNLRKLRNKIHLYDIQTNLDHDLNNFNTLELELMRETLRDILFSDKFSFSMDLKKKLFCYL
jgi:hypothetical protein